MPIYVDALARHGWMIRGRSTPSCHLITDRVDLDGLHAFAERIGMRRDWFQDKPGRPHYDLTPTRRAAAVEAGALEISSRQLVTILRQRRETSATLDLMRRQWQEALGDGTRVTCECGLRPPLRFLHRCLYCHCYFCEPCAEVHFGKTRAEYTAERDERLRLEWSNK